jgi:hypothetical protein
MSHGTLYELMGTKVKKLDADFCGDWQMKASADFSTGRSGKRQQLGGDRNGPTESIPHRRFQKGVRQGPTPEDRASRAKDFE